MTARTLAALEQVPPQSTARTLASLESEGLISRTVNPDDPRANIVVVTAEGHQTVVDNRAIRNEWLETALVQRCSAEKRELLLISGRLLRRLAETPEPADGEALSMRS
jgi:DNA-binding MarR family transcriptional regulator